MKRAPALALLALVLACGCKRSKSTPAEDPAEPAPAEPAPAEPKATCPPAGGDPLEVLVTPGNRWSYVGFQSWHSAQGEVADLELEVVARSKVGSYQVATLRRVQRPRGGEEEQDTIFRVRRGDEVLRVPCLETLPTSEQELEQAAIPCGIVEARGRSSKRALACGRVGCAAAEVFRDSVDAGEEGGWSTSNESAFWPGVGLLAWAAGEYSSETGDGQTQHLYLAGFSLASAPPAPSLAPEPADAARVRAEVNDKARAGDAAALEPLLAPDLRYSVVLEHRSGEDALESWKADGGAALRRLAEATAAPCQLVTEGVEYLLCPATAADARARATCKAEPAAGPRAIFERRDGIFKLSVLLLGGDDDLYSVPEWASGPPLPTSEQTRFDRE